MRALTVAAASALITLGSAGANPSTLVFNAGVAGAFDGLIPGSNAAQACWISAFTLNDSARLQQASVYIGGTSDKTTGSQTGLDNWTGQVLYRFYADDSNKPGAVISKGSGNVQQLFATGLEWSLGARNPVFRLLSATRSPMTRSPW